VFEAFTVGFFVRPYGFRTAGAITIFIGSFATAQKSTQTNFARSKIEQPLFGWPEGQNTGRFL